MSTLVSYTVLEEVITTGRYTQSFYLEDCIFELSTLVDKETRVLNSIKNNTGSYYYSKYLYHLLGYSLVSVDGYSLPTESRLDLLSNCQPYLLQLLGKHYTYLNEILEIASKDLIQYLHTTQSYLLFLNRGKRIGVVNQIQRDWILFNQLKHLHQERRERKIRNIQLIQCFSNDYAKTLNQELNQEEEQYQKIISLEKPIKTENFDPEENFQTHTKQDDNGMSLSANRGMSQRDFEILSRELEREEQLLLSKNYHPYEDEIDTVFGEE